MAKLLPPLKARFTDSDGDPLSGGKLWSYAAGTSTPLATYTDDSGLTPNTNPVILNANGEADVWISSAAYKFVLMDSNDVVLATIDDVTDYSGAGADGATIRNGAGAPANGLGQNGDYYINTTTQDLYFKAAGAYSVIMSLGGTAGAAGADGADGTNGNTILSGSGVPGAGVGVDGDFFYDPNAKTMYGPKATTWPAGITLSGTNGTNGADGKTVLNGAVAPTTEGVNGDFYINTATWDIYGPKTAGAWGAATSLIGPAGADGLSESGPHNVTDGQAAGNLAGETYDGTSYSSVIFFVEIVRGTTVVVTGQMSLHYVNSIWALRMAGFSGIHGVTFSITQATSIATLRAALDSGAGNGTIKFKKTYFAA